MDFNAQDLMEIVNNNEMLVIPQLYFDITEDLLSALILSNLAMWQKAHIQKLLSNGTEITEKNCGIYKFIEPCGDYLYREGDSFVETYKTSKHIISKALSLLKDKGLIETYKNGNLIFYSVNTSKIKEFSADFAKKSLTSQSKKNDLASEKNNFAKSKFLTSQSENFDAYTYTDKKTENQTEKTQKKSARISPSALAVRTGLEPATPCVTGMYSNQLNYRTSVSLSIDVSRLRVQSYEHFLILQNFAAKILIFSSRKSLIFQSSVLDD